MLINPSRHLCAQRLQSLGAKALIVRVWIRPPVNELRAYPNRRRQPAWRTLWATTRVAPTSKFIVGATLVVALFGWALSQ